MARRRFAGGFEHRHRREAAQTEEMSFLIANIRLSDFTVRLTLCLSCKPPSREGGSAARRLPHLTLTRLQPPRRRTKSAAAGGASRRGKQRRLVGFWQKLDCPENCP